MFDNFTHVTRTAAHYTHELVLDDVPDTELITEWGEEGHVVLLARCLPYIRRLVARAAGAGAADREDLQQSATLGFLKTLPTFDPTRGTLPTAYAHSTIVNELQKANRDTEPVPTKQSAHDRYCAAMAATDGDPVRAREWSRLQRLNGHALQDEQDAGSTIAADILDDRIARWERQGRDVVACLAETGRGLAPADFDTIHEALTYVSVDAPLATEGDTGTLHDVVADDATEAAFASVEDRDAAASFLAHLNEREHSIITGLFGIGGVERTATELADQWGVSRSRVLNIRKAALAKMTKAAK